MAGRRTEFELEKITINIAKGDADKLSSLYPQLGYSKVIRLLVRSHIIEVQKRSVSEIPLNLDINEFLPDDKE